MDAFYLVFKAIPPPVARYCPHFFDRREPVLDCSRQTGSDSRTSQYLRPEFLGVGGEGASQRYSGPDPSVYFGNRQNTILDWYAIVDQRSRADDRKFCDALRLGQGKCKREISA